MWEAGLLERRIAAAPAAAGFLLVLPWPAGAAEAHAGQLEAAGVAALLTLLPEEEARALGLDLAALARACGARGILWAQLALPDFGTPGAGFDRGWARLGPMLHARLEAGFGVALHCRAGLGRSGTIAARILVELGTPPEEAIARVRAARPGAIETVAQERYLVALARGPGGG